MHRIINIIKNDNYYKNIAILASGTVISHFILLITLPIISRLYTPDMFGVLTFYMSIMGLLSVVSAGKYELAIPNPKLNKKAYHLAFLAIIILLLSLVFWLILSNILIHFNFIVDKYNIVYFVLLGVFLTTIYDILVFLNIRKNNYVEINKTKITRVLSLSLSQIGFGLIGVGYFGLIAGEIFGRLTGNIRLYFSLKNDVVNNFSKHNFKHLILISKEYKDYPLYTAPAWFLNNSTIHMIPLFIVYQYGLELAGLYFMAYKIMSIPELVISQSVNQAFIGHFGEMIRTNIGDKLNFFKDNVKKLFFFAIFVSPVFGIFLFYFFEFLFGNSWSYAGKLSLYFIPLFVSQLTMSSMNIGLNLLGEQKKQFLFDTYRFISIFIVIVFTIVNDFSIEIFISLYSVVICFFYFVIFKSIEKYLMEI